MSESEESPIIQRLKEFIAVTGLTSTQFADKAGIPRPSLSQLLHGRNKSINNQILTKLDDAFPSLDIVWLLFGRGNMQKVSDFKISDAEISNDLPIGQNIKTDNQLDTSVTETFSPYSDNSKSRLSPAPTEDSAAKDAKWTATVMCGTPDNIKVEGADINGRKITSIIVLYSDNSFETFTPSDYNV